MLFKTTGLNHIKQEVEYQRIITRTQPCSTPLTSQEDEEEATKGDLKGVARNVGGKLWLGRQLKIMFQGRRIIQRCQMLLVG